MTFLLNRKNYRGTTQLGFITSNFTEYHYASLYPRHKSTGTGNILFVRPLVSHWLVLASFSQLYVTGQPEQMHENKVTILKSEVITRQINLCPSITLLMEAGLSVSSFMYMDVYL